MVLAAGAGTPPPPAHAGWCPRRSVRWAGGRCSTSPWRAGHVRRRRALAVNVHHGRGAMLAHLARHHPGVHVSVEEPEALGTAGALGRARPAGSAAGPAWW